MAWDKEVHREEFEIKLLRISKRKTHHANIVTTSTEEYYNFSCYNESLSHVVSEPKERFCDNAIQTIGLM